MYAATAGNLTTGWQTRGSWTVPGGGGPVVTADSATPNTGSGSTQALVLQYSDTWGASDLSMAWIWINSTLTSTSSGSCLLYYDRATGNLNLLNDAGTAWLPGTLGAFGTLQNSQCAVTLGTSRATLSGNTLTLNLAMTYKPAYAGAKHIYMYAANGSVSSGWQDRGLWTVP